jgi:cytochrome c-type biogenesis protein CcmH
VTPVFWISTGLMLLLAAIMLVWPFVRRSEAPRVAQRQLNISLYRSRMTELEQEHAAGQLSDDQLEAARRELENNLLIDVAAGEPEPASASRQGHWTLMGTAILLPAVALGLHAMLYEPPPGAAEQLLTAGPGADARHNRIEIEALVDQLAKRLEEDPTSTGAWVMLARSYTHLEAYPQAAAAYARAHALHGDEPDLLAEYAQALILARGGDVDDRANALVHRALEMDPLNGNALWIAGIAAYQRGEFERAADHWETLLNHLPEGSEAALMARNALAEAFSLADIATPE